MSNTNDQVNKPAHYQLFADGTEAIDVIRVALTPEEFRGYCKGNVLKYRLRAGKKGDLAQDVAKADTYADMLRAAPVLKNKGSKKIFINTGPGRGVPEHFTPDFNEALRYDNTKDKACTYSQKPLGEGSYHCRDRNGSNFTERVLADRPTKQGGKS